MYYKYYKLESGLGLEDNLPVKVSSGRQPKNRKGPLLPFFYHGLSILIYQFGQPPLALLHPAGLFHDFLPCCVESVYISLFTKERISCCCQIFWVGKAVASGYNK